MQLFFLPYKILRQQVGAADEIHSIFSPLYQILFQ